MKSVPTSIQISDKRSEISSDFSFNCLVRPFWSTSFQCDQLIYLYLMIFRLFEKSQTHSICNFKKPCLLECQPKNVKSFQCKTRDKTLLCKSQYFFHKNMSQKEQLCAGKIYGPTDRVSGNDPFSFVTSWFEWKHLMLSSSIFTGSRSSGSIWKTQQRQGNSWEGNWKGSKGARVVRLRLRFRRPVRI